MSDGSWRTISAKWTFDYRTCYARWKQKQAISLRQSALMRTPDDTWNGPVHACAALFYEFSVEREQVYRKVHRIHAGSAISFLYSLSVSFNPLVSDCKQLRREFESQKLGQAHSSSSALASCKSGVSKPSVNQP